MAVTLTPQSATLASEYAATSITFQRQILPDAQGHLQAVFTGQIGYQRTDYVLDAEGNRIATVNHLHAGPGQDPYFGSVYLDAQALAPLMAQPTDQLVFEFIADMADSLIQADLVKRGLI